MFKRHIEVVRRKIPADRPLVYDVAEGWGPLSTFLGVPAPTTPFPHVNTAEEFLRRTRRARAFMLAAPAAVLTLLAFAGTLARRRRK